MADLKVEVLKIEKIINHPNADRLDLATVLGYQVVVGRDQYVAGVSAVYFPVDSLLPPDLQDVIFSGSKMKLIRNRVRAARIRGAMSFGLLVDIPKIKNYYLRPASHSVKPPFWKVGTDLTKELGVTKYEEPVKGTNSRACGNSKINERYEHPDFTRQYNVAHLKRNVKALTGYQEWIAVTEKLHGTNGRAGWVPFNPRTKMEKFLKILSDWTVWQFVPEYEFVCGSHNVQQEEGYDSVYAKVAEKYNLRERIKFGELWFYEIIGPNIQKGYDYGLDVPEIRIIDIKQSEGYMSWYWVKILCKFRGLPPAPTIIVKRNHDGMMELLDNLLNSGPNGTAMRSTLDDTTPMEGFVVRSDDEDAQTYAGRLLFKIISDEYLLNKDNTDFH